MYADDTKLFSKVNSKDEAELLQSDLDELVKWGRILATGLQNREMSSDAPIGGAETTSMATAWHHQTIQTE